MANLGPQQFDEPGCFLNATRLQPRLERKFSDRLTAFLGYRLEYDNLTHVPAASLRALGPFDKKGLLSGLSAGVLWNHANDTLDTTTGSVHLPAAAETGGSLVGRL